MRNKPTISIIIPTYREEGHLSLTLDHILENATRSYQIILVDASPDVKTQQLAIAHRADVTFISSSIKQRAYQLNLGADQATADLLLFLHADCLLPAFFDQYILKALSDGAAFGQFSLRFDGGPAVLKLHEKRSQACSLFSGGGDQGLWMTHALFRELKGYNPAFNRMEDYDLYDRAKKRAQAIVIQEPIITSTRKYRHLSYLRVQLYNLVIMLVYKCTRSPRLVNYFS